MSLLLSISEVERARNLRIIALECLLDLSQSDTKCTGPRSSVGNVSGYRCVSDCNSTGREFDPSPGPYFHGD